MQESNLEAFWGIVQSVLVDHAGVAQEYREGKTSVLQFLVGQGMKASKGAGNPALIRDLFVEELEK
jgi:aspartyl-tRNA(Asn)/glutamyl-tRNA(Gln) amidotransferase subunit B